MDGRQKKKVKGEMELKMEEDASASASRSAVEFARMSLVARSHLRDAAVKIANEARLLPTSAVCATSHLIGNGHPNVGYGHVSTTW